MSGESQIVACRLYEKTSAGGNRYFVGLMGGVRVLLFHDQKQSADNPNGDPIWNMIYQPADKNREAPRQQRAPRKKRDDSKAAHSAASRYQAPLEADLNDDLPLDMRG